jgi:hypothetical protein
VSQKLAFSFVRDDLGKQEVDVQGNPVRKAVIEVKAEGGYCLVPPSPPRCHPTGRLYQYVEGSPDLTHVPTITPEEREIIIGSARSLSQGQEPKQPVHRRPSKPKSASLDLPGRDFNARGCWADILMPHGWVMISNYGDETRWCRPGKDGSVSATINHHGSDRLHVFTSSTEFDQDGWYDKFGAYAKLNHGGDLRKAAQDLRRQGYGKQQGK